MPEKRPVGKEKNVTELGRYAAMGFQMIVIIGVFTWIGYKIDEKTGNRMHLYTAGLSLLGVLVALVQVIRQARKL